MEFRVENEFSLPTSAGSAGLPPRGGATPQAALKNDEASSMRGARRPRFALRLQDFSYPIAPPRPHPLISSADVFADQADTDHGDAEEEKENAEKGEDPL